MPTSSTPTRGPLRVCAANPRYFADATGKALLLTGSHTWANLIDAGPTDPPIVFDYPGYLDFLAEHNHNFFRLWAWEQAQWTTEIRGPYFFEPTPYERTDPGSGHGNALDGEPKFDLSKFNEAHFNRMRERTMAARDRGIYVAVTLFDGWSIGPKLPNFENPWNGHPFHRDNNINGLDGDPSQRGDGYETHTLAHPAITAQQEAYVRKVMQTVGDLDNVLYEISNESSGGSHLWQHHLIRFIKQIESIQPMQHPVGMSSQWPDGNNHVLFDSPADWVAPNPGGTDPHEPRNEDGSKVVVDDTDHTWGIGGDRTWVWKSFLRGRNPVFMDPYDGRQPGLGAPLDFDMHDARWVSLRRNMGYVRALSLKLDLADMKPDNVWSSTGYCLASMKGPRTLVAYNPKPGPFAMNLHPVKGKLNVEWLDPQTGRSTAGPSIEGGDRRELKAPFDHDAVLVLRQS